MGQVGDLPHYYHVWKAAEILRCSYVELENHPDKWRLMRIAFTCDGGQKQGRDLLKQNPEFKAMIRKEIEAEK